MLFSNLLLLVGVAVSGVAARSIKEFLHRKLALFLGRAQLFFFSIAL